MNRRKPPLRLAAVAMAPGEDRQTAVLRKAASSALEVLKAQLLPDMDVSAMHWFSPFLAGYLMGYARQMALKHGIDCEDGALGVLAAELGRQAASLPGFGISRIQTPGGEAGCLVGRLEALCGTRHLVGQVSVRACRSDEEDAGIAFLTDCDNAADPMQSRAPTMSLRFNSQERAAILAGFAYLGQRNITETPT